MIRHGQEKAFIECEDDANFLADFFLNAIEGRPFQEGIYGMAEVDFGDMEHRVAKVLDYILGMKPASA
jgi:hypothetical protein